MRNLAQALKRAGLAISISGTHLYKTENTKFNLGMTPDLALAKALQEPTPDPKSYEGKRLGMSRKEKILDSLAMLHGRAPYDGPSNICRDDGYYGLSLEREFGVTIGEMEREVGWA